MKKENMPKITAYPFESLPIFDKSQALLVNALSSFMNDKRAGEISKVLEERAQKWVPGGFKIHLTPAGIVSSFQDLGDLDKRVGIELFQASSQSNVYLLTDPEVVTTLAEAMLGGGIHSTKSEQTLSPLAQGSFEYFVLHLLEAWNQAAPDLSLRYRRFLNESGENDFGHIHCGECLLMRGQLSLGKEIFSCLILCPLEALNWCCENKNSSPISEESLKKFDHLRTLLWAEAGRVSLNPGDLQEIQKGDVLLLDEVLPHFDGSKLSGEVRIGFGEGKGYFLARLSDTETLQVKMEHFFLEEESDYE